MGRSSIRESLGRLLRGGPTTTRVMWAVAGGCFLALAGAIIVQEARRTPTCTSPPRAEADAFTRAFAAGGRTAVLPYLASFAAPLADSFPSLRRARPTEIPRIVASGRRDAPGCDLLLGTPHLVGQSPGPCFGYQLTPRLWQTIGGTKWTGFAVSVTCENGEWRVDGFF